MKKKHCFGSAFFWCIERNSRVNLYLTALLLAIVFKIKLLSRYHGYGIRPYVHPLYIDRS